LEGVIEEKNGDTLESIALQVYGDSSLWYLIADANGITDKSASAGEKGGPLHIGMRLNLPPVASTQHHNSTTRKYVDWVGDISATPPLPALRQHSTFFQCCRYVVL
jgi:phage tail protein X